MTTLKIALAAAVLALAPGIAAAMGCSGNHAASDSAQISCAEGTMLNPLTNLCEPLTTG